MESRHRGVSDRSSVWHRTRTRSGTRRGVSSWACGICFRMQPLQLLLRSLLHLACIASEARRGRAASRRARTFQASADGPRLTSVWPIVQPLGS